jgi:hypothetical protein
MMMIMMMMMMMIMMMMMMMVMMMMMMMIMMMMIMMMMFTRTHYKRGVFTPLHVKRRLQPTTTQITKCYRYNRTAKRQNNLNTVVSKT